LFSNQLKYLLRQGTFTKIVLVRFLIILFKKNKDIELLKLNYNTNNLFKNGCIIIEYQFNNVLWYSFNNKKTLEKGIKVFNLENINSSLNLVVYGFFRKKKYSLKFEPTLTIENQSFKTNFSKLSLNLKKSLAPELTHPVIEVSIIKPKLKTSKIKINNQTLNIKHNRYNKNEFI
jgi:hypothetical protein